MSYRFRLPSKLGLTQGQYSSYDLDSCLFTSAMILVIAFFTLLARIGFQTSYFDFFAITGVSLLLCNFSVIFSALKRWDIGVGGDAICTVCLFLVIMLISFLPHYVNLVMAVLLSSAGFLSLGLLLTGSGRGNVVGKCFVWLFLPLLVVLWILGTIYAVEIHHPLFIEKITMGISNKDHLYHAAMTEMIRSYGVPSSGLYGTPFFHYHFGSHLIFARFADLFNISALEVYNFVYIIIVIPLFFRVALFLVKDLANIFSGADQNIRSGWLFWLIFSIANVNFIPERALRVLKNSATSDSWVASESYLFSMVFLFLMISISLAAFSKKNHKSVSLIASVLLCIVMALAGLSKVSTIAVAAAAGFYLAYRTKLWKSKKTLSYIFLLSVILFFVLKVVTPDSTSTKGNFYLLHTIKNHTNEVWRAFLPLTYYFFLTAYALIRINYYGITSLKELTGVIRSRKLLDVEFLLVIAVAGFIPPALLMIDGGSGIYFLDVQIRLSIVFLSAWILSLHGVTMRLEFDKIPKLLRRNSLLIVMIVGLFLNNVYIRSEDYANKNLQLRMAMIGEDTTQSKFYWADPKMDIYGYLAGKSGDVPAKLSELAYLPGKIMNESRYYSFYKWVADTSRHISHKDRYYIGIPRSDSYWQTANVVKDAIPFILPALTGIAQHNGLPENFKKLFNYGYIYYHNAGIDTVNCRPIPGKKILLLVPNEHNIFPCP